MHLIHSAERIVHVFENSRADDATDAVGFERHLTYISNYIWRVRWIDVH